MSIPLSQLIAESGWTSTPTVDVQAGSVDHFGHARAVRAASAASRVSGLVTDTTSGPHLRQEGDDVVVDTYVNRFKRMRYNVVASSNWLNVDATRGGFRIWPVFITLTYRTIDQPEPRHISDFLKLVRRHCQRRDIQCRYVWVAELQERGVLHYHVIVWMPHGYKLPKPDKQGWWPHGWSNIKKADSPVGYLAHYAGKLKSKCTNAGFAIPRGFRLYGVGGLDTDDKRKRAWANLPGWLRSLVEPWHRTKRILGGGFVSRETLEHWPSPWRIGRIVRAGSGALVHLIPALPEGTQLCPSAY